MPIDYSKWDKIELSDDSDIEVHPNVDKKSFIKWKQRDIHEKRQQRNLEIKSILLQLTMYTKLNERVDFLLLEIPEPGLTDTTKVMALLDARFDKTEKFDYEKMKEEKGDTMRKGLRDLAFDAEEIENTPPYNEMIEDLLIQVKEDHPDAAENGLVLANYLKEHRAKIDDLLLKQAIKLDDLIYQKSLLISSDDYHTGFDRSFLNKDNEEEETVKSAETPKASIGNAFQKQPKTITQTETINYLSVTHDSMSPSANIVPENETCAKTEQDAFDELEVRPDTAVFAKIPYKDLEKSAEFLIKHPYICTENQKDSLIMTAFDFQLEGNTDGARQVIYQSLLLQYIAQLAGPKANKDQTIRAIKLFFSKLKETTLQANRAFVQDVENTVNHIKQRCEVILLEHQAGGDGEEALIQLKSLDESTELLVNTPEEGTEEHEIFVTKLSPEMQAAIHTGSLDEVNKVFALMKVEDAERVLEIFQECNVIGISGVLENEEEFEKLKEQYDENLQIEDEDESIPVPAAQEIQFNTADEVD
ncbi:hypothetical protein METBIDRAFT_79626 [Metschnikowia bicuspidata var. bicuspidata NRRL YB-4993]|uniref:Hsp90 chaperone protein kinase-targeting subunit n=1 Tax=Metschnikowia bicuspidata var. bicuspidata NRRL YB-4993 TaxID=869754 RepID=A0A1A0H6T8_9ASCO|nr:hypothetical protein METBIDRAFT_79626 [Metschnikowia bicuspidata var. bicuspidata NRRL YB-4993]OBA19623.1 hypothetical protein METBIDRAFT_79626 [Metschnikowia bicuspidata var. bicuspidata NRRL YB-4993]